MTELSTGVIRRAEPWLGREMASERQVDRLRQWAGSSRFREDPHPSEILRIRSEAGQRLGELYDRMLERDAMLAGLVDKRVNAVMALPRIVEPADSSPEAAEVADFVRSALAQVPSLDQALEHQVSHSLTRGIAFDELLWERLDRGSLARAWVPVEIIDRPMHRFLFREGELFIRRPMGTDHQAAPPLHFLAGRRGTKDSPWGRALLDELYWPWYVGRHGWKYWAVFIEKWAQPTAVGKYRRSADGDTDKARVAKLLEAIDAIQTEYGVAIPEDLTLDLLEASRSGSVSYADFIGACDRAKSIRLLGEIDTSGLAKGPGSFAKSQVSNEVRVEKVKQDAHFLGAHLSDTLLRWIVRLNYGPEAPLPKLRVEAIEVEDRELRQDGIAAVLAAGEPVPRRYFYLTHQVPIPGEGEEVVVKRSSPQQPPPPDDPDGDEPDERDDEETEDGDPPASDDDPPGKSGLRRGGPRLHLQRDGQEELQAAAREAESADGRLDQVASHYLVESLAFYTRTRELFAAAYEPSGQVNWLALREELLTPSRLHARRLQTAMLHGAGFALQRLQGELGERIRLQAPPSWQGAATPETAIDFWAGVLNLPKSLFLELADSLRRLAFAVAGLEDLRLILAVHDLLAQAQAEGWGRGRFREALEEAYLQAGVDPTSDWHAELILTQNVRQAHGATLWQQTVGNPAGHRLIPYLGWRTLGDDKVREREEHNHRVVDGVIFATDHRFWRTWWVPAGFECRCTVLTFNRRRAERMGLTGSEPTGPWPLDPFSGAEALPDPGFRGVPDLAAAAEAQEVRVVDAYDRARGQVAPGLLELLAWLLQQLLGVPPGGLFFRRAA